MDAVRAVYVPVAAACVTLGGPGLAAHCPSRVAGARRTAQAMAYVSMGGAGVTTLSSGLLVLMRYAPTTAIAAAFATMENAIVWMDSLVRVVYQ